MRIVRSPYVLLNRMEQKTSLFGTSLDTWRSCFDRYNVLNFTSCMNTNLWLATHLTVYTCGDA